MGISLKFVLKGLIKPVFIQKHGLMLNKWWEAIIWNNGGLVYCCTYASYASMSWCAEWLFLPHSALISGLWPWFPMILRWFLMFLWCLQRKKNIVEAIESIMVHMMHIIFIITDSCLAADCDDTIIMINLYLPNKSDVKCQNTLGCLSQYICRGLSLSGSRSSPKAI